MADSLLVQKFFLFASFVLLGALPLRAAPITDLYEITSGTYTVIGSHIPTIWDLPVSPQAFIELTIDQELSTAEMRILGSDLEPFQFAEFEPPYFSNGDLNGDVVLFRDTIFGTSLFGFPLEGELEYDVVLDGDLISLQGELVWDPGCFDCPYILYHTGVEASVVPEPATAILLALGVAILMLRFGWQGLYFPPRKWRCSR